MMGVKPNKKHAHFVWGMVRFFGELRTKKLLLNKKKIAFNGVVLKAVSLQGVGHDSPAIKEACG